LSFIVHYKQLTTKVAQCASLYVLWTFLDQPFC